jgi:hypothetical protein
MKRTVLAIASSLVLMTFTAATAIAQTDYPPSPTTSVAGESGGTGGTAFTGGGGDLSFGTLALVVLFVAGTLALLIARKRAARLAG